MYKLRPYQKKALDEINDFIENSTAKNGVAVLPCAAGKSLIVSELAKKYDRILCLQPSKELLKQNYAKYTAYPDLEPAKIFSASLKTKEIGKVTFATPQSVANSLYLFEKFGFDYIIIDECHLGTKTSSSIHRTVKALNPKKVIGLTATPIYMGSMEGLAVIKMMNRVYNSFFKKIIHVTQIQEMVDNDYWSPLVYDNRHVDVSDLELNTTGSDYTMQSMIAMYERNNTHQNVLDEIRFLQKEGRKSILVFVPSINEAEILASKVKGAVAISSQTKPKERDACVEGFIKGSIPVVFNVLVLGTGFDHPQLDAIIHARPTNSMAIWYQTIGRGVRIHPDKKDCKVVDMAGNAVKLGRLEHLTFEDFPNCGWAMFAGDRLISGVPLMSELTTTKQELLNPPPPEERGVFDDTSFWFGKNSGRTLEQVYLKDRQYLMWFISDKFNPSTPRVANFRRKAASFIKAKLVTL